MSSPFKKFKGEIGEARFLVDALSHGLIVARPWGDSLPFDFLAGIGERFYRVQVRCSANMIGNGYKFSCAHTALRRCYSPDELDFLAAFIVPHSAWFILPVRAFFPKKNILIYLAETAATRNRFARYRDAWPLLGGTKATVLAEKGQQWIPGGG